MTFKEELEKSGQWLFRWRSYLPLLLAPLFILAWRDAHFGAGSQGWQLVWEIVCFSISLAGLGLRIATIGYVPFGTSGRNTKQQVAHALNTRGMYSLVRHPLYLGNFVIWLGISMFFRLWWFVVIISLIFWLYHERIIFTEEEFLQQKFGDAFLRWAQDTPTFVPNFKIWRPAALPFSLKTVIRKEYATFFAIIVIFSILQISKCIAASSLGEFSKLWLIIFILGLSIYLTVRIINKCTHILKVEGR